MKQHGGLIRHWPPATVPPGACRFRCARAWTSQRAGRPTPCRAEIPGVEREDVSIEVENGTLSLRAEKRFETEEEDEGYHCVERSYGSFQRVLSLPQDADEEGIEARFKNGVLKLTIPKRPAAASSARNVAIQPS